MGLFFTTFLNNLLFHSLAEIFSIVEAFSFLTITWTSRNYIKYQYFLFTGIAYLSVPYETTSTGLSR
ncbi:MAG: MASE3 domain-containing protein, partial [Anaerolineales bacterium]